ncbi:MAG: deoxynucleoside kinase [Acidobacteria bacterium]|nr:deoxynucleoside kinase [Acidobacteriota bacterium]
MRKNYIALDGPIGVGKTSLVNLMVQHLGATKILEDPDNPFLESFYKEETGAAFQAQLYYLLARYQVLTEAGQSDLFSRVTVADFTMQKDRVFAHLTLSDSELLLYEKLYGVLEPQVPKPDLIVYLQGSTDVLVERVQMRDRPAEREISRDYLAQVAEAYAHYYLQYDDTPLLVINTTEIDFVKDTTDFRDLMNQIDAMDAGRRVYVPRHQS